MLETESTQPTWSLSTQGKCAQKQSLLCMTSYNTSQHVKNQASKLQTKSEPQTQRALQTERANKVACKCHFCIATTCIVRSPLDY